MGMTMTSSGNTDKAMEMLMRFAKQAMRKCGENAKTYAQKKLTNDEHVDTGYLKNSIVWAISGEEVDTKTVKADKFAKYGEWSKELRTHTYEGTLPAPVSDTYIMLYLGTKCEYAASIEFDHDSYLRAALSQKSDIQDTIASYLADFQKQYG